jgi:hypothetical protein
LVILFSASLLIISLTYTQIARTFVGLTTLNLSFCSWLEDCDITALARLCPHLREISLFNCFRITDVVSTYTHNDIFNNMLIQKKKNAHTKGLQTIMFTL